MKHGLLFIALIAIAAVFSFVGCAENHDQTSKSLFNSSDFTISRRFDLITPQSTPTIQVFNQANQPVANAQVLIGSAVGSPFANNLKVTDPDGLVFLPEWNTATHVTVHAQGYIRQTLLNQKPGLFQVKLSTASMKTRPVIKGQVTGMPVKNGDKMIDFSLVIPTIVKSDLMSFDLDSVVSPYTDTVDIIFGKTADLPSNVSLPTQKENYNFLISLTLSKPEHRVYANNFGLKTFYAFTGKFPFKEVVDQLNEDKEFYEVMNLFQFTSGSIREVPVTGPTSSLNIPSGEIKFDGPAAVIKGATLKADEIVMLLTLNDLSGGRFVPADVRRLESDQSATLKTIAGKTTHIVSLLKKAADFDTATQEISDRSSASMVPFKMGMQTSLLPLLSTGPAVSDIGGSYKIIIPQASNTTLDNKPINELAVTVAISNVNLIQDGAQQVELLDRKWEVLGTGWPTEINLPIWPLEDSNSPASVKRKFEVNLIGSDQSKQTDLGDDLIKAATHVTKGAAEL